jgi:signal peptidase I
VSRSFTRTLLWLAAILGAIGLLLYLFVFDTWVVPGSDRLFVASIAPTLKADDRILTRRGGTPKVGELARCMEPGTNNYVIGRMMGGPNDLVEVKGAFVTTNGVGIPPRHACSPYPLTHPVTEELVSLSCSAVETGAWTYQFLTRPEFPEGDHAAKVEPGRAYLISDNRHMHKDSRDFGTVDLATCEHVVFRLWGASFTDASRRFTLLW